MKNKIKNFINASWGQILVAIYVLLGFRIYTELLPPEKFGLIMLIVGIISLLDGISTLALNQTIFAKCGEIKSCYDKKITSINITFFFLKIFLIISVFICLLYLIVFGLSLVCFLVCLCYFIYVFTESLKVSQYSLLILNKDFYKYSLWISTEALISIILISNFIYFFEDKVSFYLIGYFLSRSVVSMIFIMKYIPNFYKLYNKDFSKKQLYEASKYAIPVSFMAPLGWFSSFLDRYFIGAMINVGVAGVYAASSGLIGKPYAIITSILTNYFKSGFFSDKNNNTIKKNFYRWIFSSFIIGVFIISFLFLFGDFLIEITLAEEYRKKASSIVVLFAISQTFSIATHASDNLLLSTGFSNLLLKVQIGLMGLFLLIPVGIYFYDLKEDFNC